MPVPEVISPFICCVAVIEIRSLLKPPAPPHRLDHFETTDVVYLTRAGGRGGDGCSPLCSCGGDYNSHSNPSAAAATAATVADGVSAPGSSGGGGRRMTPSAYSTPAARRLVVSISVPFSGSPCAFPLFNMAHYLFPARTG